MQDIEEILNFVDGLVYSYTGDRLNNLQRIILKECWQDSKKTYDNIASEYDYSANYIKQGVGPKLWRLLSKVIGEKITKSNFKSAIRRQLSTANSSRASNTSFKLIEDPNEFNRSSSARQELLQEFHLEFPIDNVPLNSPFYIKRVPHEAKCYDEIGHSGAFIRIKAPKQMGKSSLMYRILNYARQQNHKTTLIHLQQAESNILCDLNLFLRWFCANLSRQLNLEMQIEGCWDELLGAKMSCTSYLQQYILEKIDRPLVIALEEVNEIIEYPQIAREFLTLLRFWHEKTKTDSLWQKLKLIMVHSTEIYIPLNINQSPLNVGLRIELEPFKPEQVRDLAIRHSLNLTGTELEQLRALLGGYPYLVRKALYHLARKDLTMDRLVETAPTEAGIFTNHLHRHLRNLESSPELISALQDVLVADRPVDLEQITGFKLHSMGLIEFVGNQVVISCDLYRRYFSDRLLK